MIVPIRLRVSAQPNKDSSYREEGMSLDYTNLQAGLRGDLIQSGDPGYDEARKLYNGMIDKKPRLIARCVDAADVMACVNYARQNGILLAVRGGGHNGPGLGSCDDGIVIDLSRMRGVRVDPRAKTVQVAGGSVWGEVDHATHALVWRRRAASFQALASLA
jgi:FAD/FMN-containing dehydrogenase